LLTRLKNQIQTKPVERDLPRQDSFHKASHAYNLRRVEYFLLRLWLDVYMDHLLHNKMSMDEVLTKLLPEQMSQYEQRKDKDWDVMIKEIHDEIRKAQSDEANQKQAKLLMQNYEAFQQRVDEAMERALPRIAYQMSLLPPDD